jgi:hypothetical protein
MCHFRVDLLLRPCATNCVHLYVEHAGAPICFGQCVKNGVPLHVPQAGARAFGHRFERFFPLNSQNGNQS